MPRTRQPARHSSCRVVPTRDAPTQRDAFSLLHTQLAPQISTHTSPLDFAQTTRASNVIAPHLANILPNSRSADATQRAPSLLDVDPARASSSDITTTHTPPASRLDNDNDDNRSSNSIADAARTYRNDDADNNNNVNSYSDAFDNANDAYTNSSSSNSTSIYAASIGTSHSNSNNATSTSTVSVITGITPRNLLHQHSRLRRSDQQ